MALDFIRKLFTDFSLRGGRGSRGSRGDESPAQPQLLQMLTPSSIGADRPAMRMLVGGITVVGIAVAGTIALSAMGVLLAALFALYFLLTQVLGLELDMDPRAFVEEAQRYAAQARAN